MDFGRFVQITRGAQPTPEEAEELNVDMCPCCGYAKTKGKPCAACDFWSKCHAHSAQGNQIPQDSEATREQAKLHTAGIQHAVETPHRSMDRGTSG